MDTSKTTAPRLVFVRDGTCSVRTRFGTEITDAALESARELIIVGSAGSSHVLTPSV